MAADARNSRNGARRRGSIADTAGEILSASRVSRALRQPHLQTAADHDRLSGLSETAAAAGSGGASGGAGAPRHGGSSFYAGDAVWMTHPDEAWVAAEVTGIDMAHATLSVRAVDADHDVGEQTAVPHTLEAEATLSSTGGGGGGGGSGGSGGSGGGGPFRQASRQPRFPYYVLPRDHRLQTPTGVENMDDMVHLHEAAVLDNLRRRFRNDLIYTSTGPILIAMNPFKRLPIYSEELMLRTHRRLDGGGGTDEGGHPHVFTTVGQSYAAMKASRGRENQSMVICGESGAGKTETTKLMLRYLSRTATSHLSSGEIEEQILESNPLMEAFGNAKTLRNDNSSRFGKYVKVQFNPQTEITGAQISNYLLEKSRIVSQPENERNYHIFYQLFRGAAPALRDELRLGDDIEAFDYLNQSGCTTVESIDDVDGPDLSFKETTDAMASMKISDDERTFIFRVLGAILHLGNVQFVDADPTAAVVADIPDGDPGLQAAGALFGVDAATLGHVLRHRVRMVGREKVESPLTVTEACQTRDALAKAVYDKLFTWLVHRINGTIARTSCASFIGILDIYGFEDLSPNGFEQLFINYANEKLQALFNEHIFKMEEEEYKREEITFNPQEFPDNQACLELIDKPPQGILMLVNEQCMRGDVGSDAALASKLHRTHGGSGRRGSGTARAGHPHYEMAGPSTPWRGTQDNFVVRHYAGKIMYTTEGFVTKNKDTLLDTIEDCMRSSSIAQLSRLFKAAGMASGGGGGGRRRGGGGGGGGGGAGRGRRQRGGRGAAVRGTAISVTVAKRFKDQLSALIRTMKATSPRFVRCIKSNTVKAPLEFEAPNVLRQLKYAGVMEALRVRRAGFPNRLPYRSFLVTFHLLLGHHNNRIIDLRNDEVIPVEMRKITRALFSHLLVRQAGIDEGQYQLGTTKVFLRADVLHSLNSVQEKLMERSIILIQRQFRVYLAVVTHERLKHSSRLLQRIVRGFLARREHKEMLRRHAEARERRRREQAERIRQEELRKIEGEALDLLRGASRRFESLQELRGPEGELLGEPPSEEESREGEEDRSAPEFCAALDGIVTAMEECRKAHEVDARAFMRAVRTCLRVVDAAHTCGLAGVARSAEELKRRRAREEAERLRRAREEQLAHEAALAAERDREQRERERMRAEETLMLQYEAELVRRRARREERERQRMAQEEQYMRWVLKERARLQALREQRELMQMRVEEEQQRATMRELLRLAEIAHRRKIAAEKERKRQLAIEAARRIAADKDMGAKECARMRREEALQRGVQRELRERWEESQARLTRIIRRRQQRELMHMRTEEALQREYARALYILELDRRNAERERLQMQNEDLASRMWSLERSLGGHMVSLPSRTSSLYPFV